MTLRSNDLRDMVEPIFEIDSYTSKMGNDNDVVTLSFSVKDKDPAEDLMSFFEKGYGFVLDADATAGEQNDDTYKVFVEIERSRHCVEQILQLLDGLKNLTGVKSYKFRYYKGFRSVEANKENLNNIVPLTADDYLVRISENADNNYKNFFKNSFLDSSNMIGNTLVLSKKYSDPLIFEFVDFGNTSDITSRLTEQAHTLNSYPEILFLTKYIGCYDISKYGDKIVIENNDHSLLLKRIV